MERKAGMLNLRVRSGETTSKAWATRVRLFVSMKWRTPSI